MISNQHGGPCLKMLFPFHLDSDIECPTHNPVKGISHDTIHVVLSPRDSHHRRDDPTAHSDNAQCIEINAETKIISTCWCEPCHGNDRREVDQRLKKTKQKGHDCCFGV